MKLLGAVCDPWARYRRAEGAITLHPRLDHDGYLPSFAVVTDGKYSELKVARGLRLEAGTILAIDRVAHSAQNAILDNRASWDYSGTIYQVAVKPWQARAKI